METYICGVSYANLSRLAMQVAFWWRLEPGVARQSMHRIELCLRLPSTARTAQVSLLLTKTLLYVHEYPPDAHRGFDIAGTRVVVAEQATGGSFGATRCRSLLQASWLSNLVCLFDCTMQDRATHKAKQANNAYRYMHGRTVRSLLASVTTAQICSQLFERCRSLTHSGG